LITQIPPNLPIVDDKGRLAVGVPFNWMLNITNLDPIVGTGSPEGVQEARVPRFYVDIAGGVGTTLYVKRLEDIGGDRTQGWTLI
jgi:hypothetical protein